MRRILITEEIKSIAKEYSLEMENLQNFSNGASPKEKLKKLSDELKMSRTVIKILKSKATKGRPATYVNHKGSFFLGPSDYVKAIHDNYDGLNCMLPSEWNVGIAQMIENKLSGYEISEIKIKLPNKVVRPFFELVVEAMRYDRVQEKILPKYIRRLGIKTCVYCNAQFATTASIQEIRYAKKNKFDIKNVDAACYELDHNKPKSKYPFLCTNFYNLQPSCSSCNRRKGDRKLDFSLYYQEGDTDTMPVHFALDPKDVIKFRIRNKCKGVKPYLCNEGSDFPPVMSDKTSKAGMLNHMLGIQGVYNEHEDIVEEVLWKHKIYSKGFMSAMINQIKSLGLEGFDMKRFILGGYYDREDDFLKRPLSIMKNDIWEQLERG